MQFRTLSQLLALAATTASALPQPASLSFDDVIILRSDGKHDIVKDHEFRELQARGIFPAHNDEGAPAARNARALTPPNAEALKANQKSKARSLFSKFRRDDCEESSEIQVTSDQTFLNWDVAMSPVASAQGGSASVACTQGYSIADALTVSSTVTASTVDSLLSASLQISTTETWTSSYQESLTYTVPAGEYGVVVSQPSVRRVQGNYLSGCTDQWTTDAFTADTYSSQSYGSMSWPTGVIRLCNSTTYPIPFCIGTGSHS